MRAMICSKCRQRPKEERRRILATEEVYGFVMQSNISAKNIERLKELASIEDAEFRNLRTLVLEIATVLPRKRRRWKLLRLNHSKLYEQIVDSGLFDDLLDEYSFDRMPHDDGITEDEVISWDDVWLENEEP
jgi:hypothetical protein